MARSLYSLLQSALALLNDLKALLAAIQRDPSSAATATIAGSPFDAARDSAALIRAHGTKLALVVITLPWTPSAAASIVNALLDGPVSSLFSAVEACSSRHYTTFARKELASRSSRVLDALQQQLLLVRRRFADAERQEQKSTDTVTAILWEACDNVGRLADMGVAGFMVHKTSQERDLLQDAWDELKSWGDEDSCSDADDDDDDDDDDNDDDNDNDTTDSDTVNTATVDNASPTNSPAPQPISSTTAQDLVDSLISQRPISRLDPQGIRPRLEVSLKRLRLVIILYQGALKRRLGTMPAVLTPLHPPPSSSSALECPVSRLDCLANIFQQLPQRFEDVAAALYSRDAASADQTLAAFCEDALFASQLLKYDWNNKRDVFAEWLNQFNSEITASFSPA
ncbi:hypothetical protein CDD81_4557 [Ophiocordyceps australis]|uniref:Cyclin-D1-binding protein 1-like N-terminal domain-containing protein n=1 Tax=Ophiocordyceps australis TaxID=1399860 RepID=A0A2C5YB46_9HYPO|nr:hypothetical protein CDD81_4557 [Ophiocordyceps australis]